ARLRREAGRPINSGTCTGRAVAPAFAHRRPVNTIGLLIPDPPLLLRGLLLRRASGWPRSFWAHVAKHVYSLLFPALLVSSLPRSPLSVARDGPAVANTMIALAAGIALSWLARPVLDPLPRHFASGAQCGFRFN